MATNWFADLFGFHESSCRDENIARNANDFAAFVRQLGLDWPGAGKGLWGRCQLWRESGPYSYGSGSSGRTAESPLSVDAPGQARTRSWKVLPAEDGTDTLDGRPTAG